MNYLTRLKFGPPETPGKRPYRGESSIIQYFPRARRRTHARALVRGHRTIELLLLLLKFLPLYRGARTLTPQGMAPLP
jgi:hypothetical protein